MSDQNLNKEELYNKLVEVSKPLIDFISEYRNTREGALAFTNLEQALMWLNLSFSKRKD